MSSGAGTSNQAERQRWNDDYWTATWPRRERVTEIATEPLLARLGLADGERVLDVGSGTGTTSLAAARLVGPGGSVLGVDISVALVELARRAAADASLSNVTFVVADAQVDELDGAPFDCVLSQFGVMFFDDPVSAFANVRAQVMPGGRLAFACWRSAKENPWFIGHALAGLVPAPAPPAPGLRATGPFTMSDPVEIEALLGEAGWRGVRIEPLGAHAALERDVLADKGQPAFLGVPPELLDVAEGAIEAYLAPYRRDDGRFEMPLAFQVVTASNPS